LETATEIQGQELTTLGYEVVIITETTDPGSRVFPFQVVRNPSPWQLLRLVFWSDIFLHNGVSLQLAWPLIVLRRPWVVAHHSWIVRRGAPISWLQSFKRYVLRFAQNLCISQAIAEVLPVKSIIMGEPYDENVFHLHPTIVRDQELIYLGRLVSDKGIDLLLEAVRRLKTLGKTYRLTVVGDGEQRDRLETFCQEHQLREQVTFLGIKRDRDLAQILSQHQVLVVPSRWEEPFGIVVLEGIACGCMVVGSVGGGLKEAIGPCGLTFPNGEIEPMMSAIVRAMQDSKLRESCRKAAPEHLARFTRRAVIERYLEVLPKQTKTVLSVKS
jgi:glycosyltransferase involved in cell wall biosynthesis